MTDQLLKTTRGSALGVITERAAKLAKQARVSFDRKHAMIVLRSLHHGSCPLRITDLAKADDFNLAHDVFGILNHYDPITGKLINCFRPRFAAQG